MGCHPGKMKINQSIKNSKKKMSTIEITQNVLFLLSPNLIFLNQLHSKDNIAILMAAVEFCI